MPNEVLEYIFSFLDLKDLGIACGVCHRWKEVSYSNDTLWRRHLAALLMNQGVLFLPTPPPFELLSQDDEERTRKKREEGEERKMREGELRLRELGGGDPSCEARRLMRRLCSMRKGYEEEIIVAVEGGRELRASFIEALMHGVFEGELQRPLQERRKKRIIRSRRTGKKTERAFVQQPIRVFHQGLMYQLRFEAGDPDLRFNLSEHIVLYIFRLDGAEGMESLWAMERAHLLVPPAVQKKEEVPVVLLGLKDIHHNNNNTNALAERDSARNCHILCEDLCLSETQLAEGEGEEEGGEGEGGPLLQDEEDIEREGGDSASESVGEDVVRREARQYARQRMRCNCYMEAGWHAPSPSPTRGEEEDIHESESEGVEEVVEPLVLLSALLEVRRRVKESVVPGSYHSSRARLQLRQHGSPLFSFFHVLEGLFSLILLPLPGVVRAVGVLIRGIGMMGEVTLRAHRSTSIPTLHKTLLCLFAFFPLLFWSILFAFRALAIAFFSPFLCCRDGFYRGYHDGFGESARHAWREGWSDSERDHVWTRELVEKIAEGDGVSIELCLLRQAALPYIFLTILLFVVASQWWMSRPSYRNPLQPFIN